MKVCVQFVLGQGTQGTLYLLGDNTNKFLRDLVKQDDISTLKHEQMPVIAGAVHFGVY